MDNERAFIDIHRRCARGQSDRICIDDLPQFGFWLDLTVNTVGLMFGPAENTRFATSILAFTISIASQGQYMIARIVR